jgi:hypothetical protein
MRRCGVRVAARAAGKVEEGELAVGGGAARGGAQQEGCFGGKVARRVAAEGGVVKRRL